MPNASKSAAKLLNLVKRDYERICAVTPPVPKCPCPWVFPNEIWLDHIRLLKDRCKTERARARLAALWYAVFKL